MRVQRPLSIEKLNTSAVTKASSSLNFPTQDLHLPCALLAASRAPFGSWVSAANPTLGPVQSSYLLMGSCRQARLLQTASGEPSSSTYLQMPTSCLSFLHPYRSSTSTSSPFTCPCLFHSRDTVYVIGMLIFVCLILTHTCLWNSRSCCKACTHSVMFTSLSTILCPLFVAYTLRILFELCYLNEPIY